MPATITIACFAAASIQACGRRPVGHLLGQRERFLARLEHIAGVAQLGQHRELGARARGLLDHLQAARDVALLLADHAAPSAGKRRASALSGSACSSPLSVRSKRRAAVLPFVARARRHERRAAASARRTALPAICRPIGSPSRSNPQGIDIAGKPVRLYGIGEAPRCGEHALVLAADLHRPLPDLPCGDRRGRARRSRPPCRTPCGTPRSAPRAAARP